jgi:DNA repair exonuclease SbcCD ATPase subunit
MKITILFLAVISLAFVASNEMCRQTEIKVYSSMQAVSQSFNLDVKKLKGIEFQVDEDSFKGQALIPIEQVGLVLEKTASSKTLDAIHHKYLRNEPESVWMPYSYTGEWSRAGYVITNQMKRTSASRTETPLVSFEFVNDFDLMSVTNVDMDAFLTNLRYNSQRRKIIKLTVKNEILKSHDAYTQNVAAKAKMVATNNDAKSQIVTLKATLTKTVTEINTLTTKITEFERQESVKSAELSNINDQIDEIISKLVVLNKQLKKAEAELDAQRPTDVSVQRNSLNLHLLSVQYPQKRLGSY